MSSTNNFCYDGNLEIRKLPQAKVTQLATVLDVSDQWINVMSIIPCSQDTVGPPYLYSAEEIMLVSRTAKNRSCSPTELLLAEWGITNRKRPTLSILLDCLIAAKTLRAADLIAEFINVPRPSRPLDGPQAWVITPTISESDIRTSPPTEDLQPSLMSPFIVDNAGGGMHKFRMKDLAEATNSFSPKNSLGDGSFGNVYVATLSTPWGTVAVKRLNEIKIQMWADERSSSTINCGHPMNQFINEIKVTSQVKHKNLLAVLGYSEDPQSPPCIVYEFMINGSLFDRLTDKTELGWNTRLKISQGTAEGIHYLHNQTKPLIHRDVKSANILLDVDLNPKLGDYGLMRVGSNTTTRHITKAFGTLIYMSPEAVRGEVSVKMDVYSFGVVLLELVSGLPVIEQNRETDLVTQYQDLPDNKRDDIWDIEVGWPTELPTQLLRLVDHCLKKRKDRPTMSDVVSMLNSIINKYAYYV